MQKMEKIIVLIIVLILIGLVIYTKPQEIKQDTTSWDAHKAYCENIYFQPNAEEKLKEANCNLQEVEKEIYRVRSGKY